MKSPDEKPVYRSARNAQKTDPSVSDFDLYLQGEPRGSVPMDITIGKPRAYYPPEKGPK